MSVVDDLRVEGPELVSYIKENDVESLLSAMLVENFDVNATYGGRVEDYILKGGKTLLVYAVTEGNYVMCDLLLQHGADVNFRGYHGHTALHYASRMGLVEVVELLLGYNCDVNTKDNSGKIVVIFFFYNPSF